MKLNPLQLMSLYKLVEGKSVSDMDLGLLSKIAKTAGVQLPEPQLEAILGSLQQEEMSTPLLEWAAGKMQDGSIERWLGQPEKDVLFTRCPHCQMPFTISVND